MFRGIQRVAFLVLLGAASALATTPNTITIDGDLGDWEKDEIIYTDSGSDGDWEFNEIYALYATWDADNFYFGVSGAIEQANSYSIYFDTGAGSSCTDLSTIAWEKQLNASGWHCDFSLQASGQPDYGVFRVYGNWDADEVTTTTGIESTLDLGRGIYEAKVPWRVIYPSGVPSSATFKIVATLTGLFEWDAGDAAPNQTTGPIGDGVVDMLDKTVTLTIDGDGDGTPNSGWHPNTNSEGGNQPPIVSISADPMTGSAPLEVEFLGLASDPDVGDSIASMTWELPGGVTRTEENFFYTFDAPGTYHVTLKAKDQSGAEGSDSVDIEVVPAPGSAWMDLTTTSSTYHPGQQFSANMYLQNGNRDLPAQIFIVLEVFGTFYFWPAYSTDPYGVSLTLPANFNFRYTFMEFPVDASVGNVGPLTFYGALIDNGGAVLGQVAQAQFSFANP